MTVGRDYLLTKPSGPSVPKLFFDVQVVPLAVNAAGSLEVMLDRTARRLGLRPSTVLAGSAAFLSLGMLYALRARRGEGSRRRA